MLLDGEVRHSAFSKDTAWIKDPVQLCAALIAALQDFQDDGLLRKTEKAEQNIELIITQAILILQASIHELGKKVATCATSESLQYNRKTNAVSQSSVSGSSLQAIECKRCRKAFTPFNRSRSCTFSQFELVNS
ncbi:unnamed protein product [Albugo candida]|uniref:Uncharacterized protein n=1 Tax=Albugo candida TaxID=65357 RepID=A0A024G4F6_9STRA|nr:unnamed protein product [Albugo candida]|eukprot:CCI41744.1 unnamed protein product [Albugo candida]